MARAALRAAAAAALVLAFAAGAQPAAPSVALAGVLGSKALLIVDQLPPRAVAAGESHQGVRVMSVGRDEAVVEVGGRRATLRMGDGPTRVGRAAAEPGGRRIVMTSDGQGHFFKQGSINGQVTQFLVDTGASSVGIGQAEAERMGLPYRSGEPVRMATANGVVQGWRLKLASVRLGDVELREVDAVVTPQAMPFVLLGNSFLTQFQMTRMNDQMVLEKRF